MLKFMRRKSKSIFVYLIFGVIILVFVFWGMGRMQPSNNNIVASINEENTITVSDYYRVYQNQLNFYRDIYKENFTEELIEQLNLKEKTIEGMITSVLLINEAKKLNIEVSPREVLDQIRSYPAFQSNGTFDKNEYLRVLQRNRITPARFEEDIINDLIAQKIERIITLPVDVSDSEVKDFFNFSERRTNLQYVTINASSFLNSVDVSDEEAREYFENSAEEFQVPTKINVGYLRLRPQDFASAVKVSDEEIEEYYSNNSETYIKKEEIKASHILIKTSKDDDADAIEKKRKKIDEIRERAVKGEDFTSLAQEFSEDTASAKKGGDLGYFGKGQMVKSFEEAAFSLKVGEISDVVRSTFGFHIITVNDRKEARKQPLDEVRSRIITTITTEKAKNMARKKAQELADLAVKDETSLKETVSKAGFEVSDTGLFGKGERSNPVAVNPELSETAFSMRKNEISNALEIPGSVFVMTILDRVEEHIPTYDDVSNSVRSVIKEKKSGEMASEKAQEYIDKLSGETLFADLAKENNLKLEETGLFSMNQGFAPAMNVRITEDSPIFSLNQSAPYATLSNGGKHFVIKLKETHLPPEEAFEEKKEEVRRNLIQLKRNEFFTTWLESLRSRADIKIYSELL